MAFLKYDLTGMRFGKYLVIERSSVKAKKSILWKCKCDCGRIRNVDGGDLRRNRSSKCPSCRGINRILKRERKPDIGKVPEYRIWSQIKGRCTNTKNKDYKYYGGRGIKLCELWMNSYEEFINSVGLRPSPDLTIDRIDNDGNYEPGNVRWTTRRNQCLNRRKFKIKNRKL